MAEAASWKKKEKKSGASGKIGRNEEMGRRSAAYAFLVNVFRAYHLLAFHPHHQVVPLLFDVAFSPSPPPPFFLIPSVFFTMPSDIRLNGPTFQERYFHRYSPWNWIFRFYFQFYFARGLYQDFSLECFIFCFIYFFDRLLTWLLLSSSSNLFFISRSHFIKFATQRWSETKLGEDVTCQNG